MPVKEVLGDVSRWQASGERAAIRVVGVRVPAARSRAAMAVSRAKSRLGLRWLCGGSGGGSGARDSRASEAGVITFRYSDNAFSVGLTCGGTIHFRRAGLRTRGRQRSTTLSRGGARRSRSALVTVVGGTASDRDVGAPGRSVPRPPTWIRWSVRRARRARGGLHPHYGEHGEAPRKPSRCSSSRSWFRRE